MFVWFTDSIGTNRGGGADFANILFCSWMFRVKSKSKYIEINLTEKFLLKFTLNAAALSFSDLFTGFFSKKKDAR
jgi:hypothetical protein